MLADLSVFFQSRLLYGGPQKVVKKWVQFWENSKPRVGSEKIF